MKRVCISIGKPGEGCVNEDAVRAEECLIAVSDGAGGGGLFADRWSRYLLDKLPKSPLCSADEADAWLENIWEAFYNEYEQVAVKAGGLLLDKFYDEGSFATLVAVWKTTACECRWITYGDSMAFHYNRKTKRLEHSFGRLADFDNPPYLINCKEELNKEGFYTGQFAIDEHSVMFVASDALSHYILMMYEVMNHTDFEEELLEALNKRSKNENYIRTAMSSMPFDFEKDVLDELLNSMNEEEVFTSLMKRLVDSGLAALDDYSLAVM